MAMSEKSRIVFDYLKANYGAQMTAADIADALGMEKKSVDGAFTASIQRKGLGERISVAVEDENGKPAIIKLLTLNEEGMAYDPDAVVEEA